MTGLTIGDDEFVGLAKLLDLTLLVHSVGLLIVDEEVGGAGTAHPLLENLLVWRLVEGLLHKRHQIQIMAVSVTGRGRAKISHNFVEVWRGLGAR